MPITAHSDQQGERTQHLFMVRLWQETDAVTATTQWRGSVKHVLTEQTRYFTHLPDLLSFINMVTTPPGAEGGSGEKDLFGA